MNQAVLRRILSAAMLAAVLALSALPGCGAVAAPGSDDATAFDFRFTLFQGGDLLGGDSLDLSDLRGTPVVLNFWARLCTPCWAEMPELQDFYEEFGARVHLLGIDIGKFTGLGSPKDASSLLDSLGIAYPAGLTEEGAVVRAYEVRVLPTTVFITAEGKVFRIWAGALDRQEVTEITEAMLKEGTR